MTEPRQIRAGETVTWERTLDGHEDGDGNTVAYNIVGREGALAIATTKDGGTYTATIAAADTRELAPGSYRLAGASTDSGGAVTYIYDQPLEITPDLMAQEAGYDTRTENEIILEAIQAVIAKRATLDQQSYTIATRTLNRMDPEELLRWESIYRGRVESERIRNRTTTGHKRRHLARFTG